MKSILTLLFFLAAANVVFAQQQENKVQPANEIQKPVVKQEQEKKSTQQEEVIVEYQPMKLGEVSKPVNVLKAKKAESDTIQNQPARLNEPVKLIPKK